MVCSGTQAVFRARLRNGTDGNEEEEKDVGTGGVLPLTKLVRTRSGG